MNKNINIFVLSLRINLIVLIIYFFITYHVYLFISQIYPDKCNNNYFKHQRKKIKSNLNSQSQFIFKTKK